MKQVGTVRARENVRRESARTINKLRTAGASEAVIEEAERLAFAIDILCDVVAYLEFHNA